jgi:hypothetical protein
MGSSGIFRWCGVLEVLTLKHEPECNEQQRIIEIVTGQEVPDGTDRSFFMHLSYRALGRKPSIVHSRS